MCDWFSRTGGVRESLRNGVLEVALGAMETESIQRAEWILRSMILLCPLLGVFGCSKVLVTPWKEGSGCIIQSSTVHDCSGCTGRYRQ